MMNEKRLKYFFYFSSVLLLILMLMLSRNAGISCDEMLHYNQSVSVYNFFASHGKDQSALNTPVTNLKYYGQSYDNIVTILTKWFRIDNVYLFRNHMSSLAGWLAVFITALFAVWLKDFKAGILVILLFVISPTFFGHAQNNLKDIPFALGYISGIFFILKFFFSEKHKIRDSVYLTVSLAFTISIRAAGLILLCYLFLFFFIWYAYRYIIENKIDFPEAVKKLLLICIISLAAWFLSIVLWPFVLQSPVKNMISSYNVMAHFPGTFRQIFEGRVEWSDFMPWYYIPKSMLITIPLTVTVGLIPFLFFSIRKSPRPKILQYGFIIFSILFPLLFVIIEKSNVYSSWRQFLFLYPGVVLLAAIGYSRLFEIVRKAYMLSILTLILILMSVHPVKFMLNNPGLYYIYYNQLVGGVQGAYSNYELDYYYTSQTMAAGWLKSYLSEKEPGVRKVVKATYPVDWQFREHPEIETSYFRFEERSLSDWDYAIVTNRYITPFKLRNRIWPPSNAIHIIYADSVPVCAVLERKTKDDYEGYLAMKDGRNAEAAVSFEKALRIDNHDEMIFYNFGATLLREGLYLEADSVLKKGLEINPEFEPLLMYLGNIALSQNKADEAAEYYQRVLRADRKYFEAYVKLAELLKEKDVNKARILLKTCLDMNPKYKPAIKTLADTYRSSDPDIARKYDELAETIE